MTATATLPSKVFSASRIIIAISLVITLAVTWVKLLAVVEHTENNAFEQVKLRAQDKAETVSSVIQTTVDYYDLALLTTHEAALQGANAFAQRSRLVSENLTASSDAHLFFIDKNGYVASSSYGPVPRSYVGDRDYFRRLTNSNYDMLLFGSPVMGRISSAWIIPLARGVYRDGKLTGVTLLSIPVMTLRKQLEGYVKTPHSALELISPDGQFIVRTLQPNDAHGKRVATNRPYLQQPSLKSGYFISSEPDDDAGRLIAWSRLPNGLIVTVGVSIDEVLTPARETTRLLILGASLVSGLLSVLAVMLILALSHIERLARKRASNDKRFHHLIGAMREGVVELDNENRIVRINPAFTTITGYVAENAVGKDANMLSPDHDNARILGHMVAQWIEAGAGEGDFDGLRVRGDSQRAFIGHAALAASSNDGHHFVLLTDVSRERRKDEEIWHEANYDPLTGLANRELMLDHLELMAHHTQSHKCGLAVLFVDLDYCVPNSERNSGIELDTRLLHEAARRLRELFHAEDTIAHLHANQFIVLFSDFGAASVAERAAARVVSLISDPFTVDAESRPIEIICSVGVARHPDQGHSAVELLHAAEQAMLRAKSRGHSNWSV
jgi:diguanylate cyclase (GGDEF)-like protein/PAS domain S-box-containing protein